MKTQNTKLVLEKYAVVELQNNTLLDINGGTMGIYPSVTIAIAELTEQIACGGGEDGCVTR